MKKISGKQTLLLRSQRTIIRTCYNRSSFSTSSFCCKDYNRQSHLTLVNSTLKDHLYRKNEYVKKLLDGFQLTPEEKRNALFLPKGLGFKSPQGDDAKVSPSVESSNKLQHRIERAENGEVQMQYRVARCYHTGEGTNKDVKAALYWYEKAALNGHLQSQRMMGWAHSTYGDLSIQKSVQEAFRWYKMAADQGDSHAQLYISSSYLKGQGTSMNLVESFKWALAAAEKGSLQAQIMVGKAYAEAIGVGSNMKEAERWLSLAAKQGNMHAERELKKLRQIIQEKEHSHQSSAQSKKNFAFNELLDTSTT